MVIYIYEDKTNKHDLTQVATDWCVLREPRQFNLGCSTIELNGFEILVRQFLLLL